MQWKCCLLLATLILFPSKIGCEENVIDDEDESTSQEQVTMSISMMPSRRQSTTALPAKVQLECYTCTYNDKQSACLDPVKYRMAASKCPGLNDKCFSMLKLRNNQTSRVLTNLVVDRDDVIDVVRGCLRNCTDTASTQCCDLNRCNYRPYNIKTRRVMSNSFLTRRPSSTLLYVFSALLLLQAVLFA